MSRIEGSDDHLATIARKMVVSPAAREVIPLLPGESFRWLQHDYPSEMARWNYHPEVEIHLVRKSRGSYIIGDQIGPFGPGQVTMVGSGLPHDWMSDRSTDEVIDGRDAVIQFLPEWADRAIAAMPELSQLGRLVENARQGIIFSGQTAVDAASEIEAVGAVKGARRMSHLFALFAILSEAPEAETQYVAQNFHDADAGREGRAAVEAGLAYILENLAGKIRMSEAAKLALMSEPSFSRYFRRASGLTFSDTVKRLRIANACRMLDETDRSVSSISAAVGYTNLANFNRQFLAELSVTPRQYRALEPSEKPHSSRVGLDKSGRPTEQRP